MTYVGSPGDQVREAREALGLSRAQLAAQVEGVSERTIVRVERGEHVSTRTVETIFRHLRLGKYRGYGPTIREATDTELAEELLRRAQNRERDERPDLPRLPNLAPVDEQGFNTEAARKRRPVRNLDAPPQSGT